MTSLLSDGEIEQIRKIPLVDFIGEGSFGKVYKIMYNNKPYAIKKQDYTKGDVSFDKEVEAHKNLSLNPETHPFVPVFYGSFTDEDSSYIIMEYLDGISLYSLCKHKKLTENEIQMILNKIKTILETFHKVNYIFNDLQASNIFIELTDNAIKNVKFIDFGTTRKVGEPLFENNLFLMPSIEGNLQGYGALEEEMSYCKKNNSKGGYKRTRKSKKKSRKTKKARK